MKHLTKYEKHLLSRFRQMQLAQKIQDDFQQVRQFREQIISLNYKSDNAQVAYLLFLTEKSQIHMLDNNELLMFTTVLGGQKIPKILEDKYQAVLSKIRYQQRLPILVQLSFIVAFMVGYIPVLFDGINKWRLQLPDENYGYLGVLSSLGPVFLVTTTRFLYRYWGIKCKPIILLEGVGAGIKKKGQEDRQFSLSEGQIKRRQNIRRQTKG